MPFLHPESFRLSETPSVLLLAVLSIGALYPFNQDQAYRLHIGLKYSLMSSYRAKISTLESVLCGSCKVLNMAFASWSG